MSYWPGFRDIFVTAYTLGAGALGALIGYWIGLPVYLLTGPALLISLATLTGLHFAIAPVVRDFAFILIGISIGAGVDPQAAEAFMRWPIAFLMLAFMLILTLILCRDLLVRVFGFDPRSAVLAASPGHLSYIISLSESMKVDISRVAVVQSVRLLALTLCVPFAALAFGIRIDTAFASSAPLMRVDHAIVLFCLSLVFGLILKRANAPAALLIAAMIVSAVAHLSERAPGVLSPQITHAMFVVMGTLIGTRFSGIHLAALRKTLVAGLSTTLLTVLLAMAAAVPVAYALGLPVAHVLIAFAPGGLETMVVMGVVLGANPGFVAACHVARLLFLTVLVPAVLARAPKDRSLP